MRRGLLLTPFDRDVVVDFQRTPVVVAYGRGGGGGKEQTMSEADHDYEDLVGELYVLSRLALLGVIALAFATGYFLGQR